MGPRGRCRLGMFGYTLLIAWGGTALLGCCSCTTNSSKVGANRPITEMDVCSHPAACIWRLEAAQQDSDSSKPRKELHRVLLQVTGKHLCTRKRIQSFIYIHAHTHMDTYRLAHGHCWCSWLAVTLALVQTKSKLTSSPPYSEGSKGCFKETLLSKVCYEDRFLCISNQSSKSRDQFRCPSAAQGVKKNIRKTLQLGRGEGKQRVKNTINQKVLLRKAAG